MGALAAGLPAATLLAAASWRSAIPVKGIGERLGWGRAKGVFARNARPFATDYSVMETYRLRCRPCTFCSQPSTLDATNSRLT